MTKCSHNENPAPKEGTVLHLAIKDNVNKNIDVQYVQQGFCRCPFFLRMRKSVFV